MLGPMVAGGGSPASPLKMEPGVVKAVAAGVAAGFDVTYVNATDACGATLTGCVDGCGGGHPGESGHRGLYYRRPTHHHFINPLTPYPASIVTRTPLPLPTQPWPFARCRSSRQSSACRTTLSEYSDGERGSTMTDVE